MGRLVFLLTAIALMAAPDSLAQQAGGTAAQTQAERDAQAQTALETALEALANDPSVRQEGRPTLSETFALEQRAQALVRQHIDGCWREQRGSPTIVHALVTLNEDGSLLGQPNFVRIQFGSRREKELAVRRALEAILQCAPFPLAADPALGEHYEMWRQIELVFHPPSPPRR